MKHTLIAGLAVLVISITVHGAEPESTPGTRAEKTKPTGQWHSEPPADCPFKPSAALAGVEFTGRHAEYTTADTWYPTWASDGNLMWLCYSANFAAGWGKADIQSRPEGSKYAMCLQEMKLLQTANLKSEPQR